jgi:hypothetical protein
MTLEQKVELYWNRMLRHRLDDNKDFASGWCTEMVLGRGAKEKIRKHLEDGKTIKTGWTTSGVRGFHQHYILYK